MLFCHRLTRTKAGQRPVSHRAHRGAEKRADSSKIIADRKNPRFKIKTSFFFIAVAGTAMKNLLFAYRRKNPAGLRGGLV
jgi:hypothetical protein